MLICGALLLAAGLASIIYGYILNNDYGAQVSAIFTSGSANPGTIWIIIGIVWFAVGAVLLAVILSKKVNTPPI